jgi:hypothetical protein
MLLDNFCAHLFSLSADILTFSLFVLVADDVGAHVLAVGGGVFGDDQTSLKSLDCVSCAKVPFNVLRWSEFILLCSRFVYFRCCNGLSLE